MPRYAILLVILSITHAHAETQPRCGTDAFGNRVCMDKDGVLSNAPREPAVSKDKDRDAPALTKDDSKAGEREVRRRCAADPFGNEVCREW